MKMKPQNGYNLIFSEDLNSQVYISSSKYDSTHKNVALDEKYVVSLAGVCELWLQSCGEQSHTECLRHHFLQILTKKLNLTASTFTNLSSKH